MENTVYIRRTLADTYKVFCSPEASAVIELLPCVNAMNGPYGKAEYYIFRDSRYSHDDFMAAIREQFEVKT